MTNIDCVWLTLDDPLFYFRHLRLRPALLKNFQRRDSFINSELFFEVCSTVHYPCQRITRLYSQISHRGHDWVPWGRTVYPDLRKRNMRNVDKGKARNSRVSRRSVNIRTWWNYVNVCTTVHARVTCFSLSTLRMLRLLRSRPIILSSGPFLIQSWPRCGISELVNTYPK